MLGGNWKILKVISGGSKATAGQEERGKREKRQSR